MKTLKDQYQDLKTKIEQRIEKGEFEIKKVYVNSPDDGPGLGNIVIDVDGLSFNFGLSTKRGWVVGLNYPVKLEEVSPSKEFLDALHAPFDRELEKQRESLIKKYQDKLRDLVEYQHKPR